MAAQFCMGCGSPLAPNAKFCASCGTGVAAPPMSAPMGSGAGPAGMAAPPAAPIPPPPTLSAPAPPPPSPAMSMSASPPTPPSPPLGEVLGLTGRRNFLLQHILLSGARNYRVLDHEKHPLFTVKESVQQELQNSFQNGPFGQGMGMRMGGAGPPMPNMDWVVEDSSGNVRGNLRLQVSGNEAISTLSGSDGVPVLAVRIDRGLVGGLHAYVGFPNGPTMFETQGNLLRHSFQIKDPSGREVAKIHEAFVSVRDTYNLDLLGEIDPLAPLILAIVIDREKEASSAPQSPSGGIRMGNAGREIRL
ncbi:MAG TPA: hypothetical protein VGS23_05410 [Thermoplasmata archaeon]|nr:hypothetical protein [Thermoplasmata archaeon]